MAVHRAPIPFRQKRPWVARIRGLHRRYGLDRDFMPPLKDYTHARRNMKRELRGVVYEWLLQEGELYEIHDYQGKKERPRRRFCRVEDGKLVEMAREEVFQWLANSS